MHRRAFVRLLAAASAGATVKLDASQQQRAATAGGAQHSEVPPMRIVSSYAPAKMPGMPGPYPGRVVAVQSDKSVDTATNTANADIVREMMARGMQKLTGTATTADAWRRFF